MAAPPLLHDLTCVVHAHSRHSDGTGTIPQVAAAARRAGVDVVLLTDHDTLAGLDEEGWYGSALVLVGEEVSPPARDHTLAFGLRRPIRHRGLNAGQICAAVAASGGVAFAAHPFSRGSQAFPRFGTGTPFTDLDAPDLTGIELWSFVTDTAESLAGYREAAAFVARPGDVLTCPPRRNLDGWDRLCERRRLVAIGGVDAHQIGIRVGRWVPLRLMSYARSFSHVRTHVLCEELPSGDLDRDRAQVLRALAEGRCYIAVDSLAPARGFTFWAQAGEAAPTGADAGRRAQPGEVAPMAAQAHEARPTGADAGRRAEADEARPTAADAGRGAQAGEVAPMGAEVEAGRWTLTAQLPRPARLRLLAGGRELAATDGSELSYAVDEPGAYRVEALIDDRTWILSNPIYLR